MKRTFKDRAIAITLSVVMVLLLFAGIDLGTGKAYSYATGLTIGGSGSLTPYTNYPANVGVTFAKKSTKNIIEVGLTRNSDTYMQATNGISTIENNYKTKVLQNANNSLFFVNDSLYGEFAKDGSVALGYYNGSGTMQFEGSSGQLARIRQLGSATSSSNVYYDQIKSLTDAQLLSSWKTIAKYSDYSKCLSVWNWILQINGGDTSYNYDIKNRIDQYTKTTGLNLNDLNSLNDADRAKVKYAYIDLLMTMYVLTMGSDTNSSWETAINDYIDGTKLEESPVTILIGDCVKMYLGSSSSTNSLITRVYDYLQYAAGIENAYRLDKTAGYTTIKSTAMLDKLKEQADLSKAASPTKARCLDVNSATEPFSSGYSAMVAKRLYTNSSPTVWGSRSYTGVALDAIQLTPNNKGFMLVPSVPTSSSDFNIGLTATIDGKSVKIVSNRNSVGSVVQLKVTGNNTSKNLAKWETILDSYSSFKVAFEFTRKDTGANTAPNFKPTTGIYPSSTVWDSNRLRLFLSGSESVMEYMDSSVMNELIADKEVIQYDYDVTMHVYYGPLYINEATAKSTSVAGAEEASGDIVTVLRQDNANTFRYDSVPQSYSEIKEGTPREESFDAMAGVPSTETLYFAAGGSEFIAQVELEYIKDETATRTYNDVFHGTDCEFKAGDVGKSGGSSNVTVTLVSGNANGAPNSYGSHASGTMTSPTLNGGSDGGSGHGTVTWGGPGADPRTYRVTVNRDSSLTWLVTETATWHDTSTTSASHAEGHGSGTAENPHSCGHGACSYTGTKQGYYTYTLTAHILCGPCCEHVLPEVKDTWKQTVAYDYVKIIDCHVWKIDKASVNGMSEIELNNTDLIKASIQKGDPNLFYNFAQDASSRQGRLRYTVEPQQHDAVTWEENNASGQNTRSNKCNGLVSNRNGKTPSKGHGYAWATGILYNNTSFSNEYNYHKNSMVALNNNTNSRADSVDAATLEYNRFNERRTTKNIADVISDMLILQTSSGDQSIMYFNKKSAATETQANFVKVASTKTEMWDNNPNSAAKWSTDAINIGSYNGKFEDTAGKYNGSGNGKRVTTSFDNDPASKVSSESRAIVADPLNYRKPASTIGGQSISSPANLELRMDRVSDLLLYNNTIKQKPTNPNKSYITGNAEVFWKSIIQYKNTNGALYSTSNKTRYGLSGYVQNAPYSPNHTKVNDIIVHDPVSVSDAIVVGLDESRDQRSSMPIGSAEQVQDKVNALDKCPGFAALCDFRVLNCTYFQDVALASFDFETAGNTIINSKTGDEYTLPSGFTIDKSNYFGTGYSLNAAGTRLSIPLSDLELSYKSTVNLRLEADVYLNNSKDTMLFSYKGYGFFIPKDAVNGSFNTGVGAERRADYNIVNKKLHIVVDFDWNSTDNCKVYVQPVGGTLTEVPSYTRLISSNEITDDYVGGAVNIGSWSKDNLYPANFKMDNLVITRLAGSSEHTSTCYKNITVHDQRAIHVHTAACYAQGIEYDCNNLPLNSGGSGSQDFNYTGGAQTFTAPVTGTYILETWGAQGGSGSGYSNAQAGTYGSKTYGTLALNEGDVVTIYVGGAGGDGYLSGSYNAYGGSAGYGYGSYVGSGGGSVRRTCSSHHSAAGGGGGGATVIIVNGVVKIAGAGGTGGYCDSHNGGRAGGGAGGPAYTAGLGSLTVSNGVKSGNGSAKITWAVPSVHVHTEDCISARAGDLAHCTGELNTLTMLNAHIHTDACFDPIDTVEGPAGYNFGDGSKNGITAGYTTTNVYVGDNAAVAASGYNGRGNINSAQINRSKLDTYSPQQLNAANGGYNGSSSTYYSRPGDPQRMYTGGNNVPITADVSNQLLVIGLHSGNLTCTMQYQDLKLTFNGVQYTVNQAIEAGFVEPFVPVESSYNTTYEMATPLNIISGGNTGTNYWSYVRVYLNIKDVSPTNVYCYTNMNSKPGDGFQVWSYNTNMNLGKTAQTTVYGGVLADAVEKHISGDSTDLRNILGGTVFELVKNMTSVPAIFDVCKANIGLIPDKLDDGQNNPLFVCDRPYNIHICNQNCSSNTLLVCDEPHHNGLHYDGSNEVCWDACFNDLAHKFYKPTVTTPTGENLPNGKFVNIDYAFQVYFPNIGDFEQGQMYGISKITDIRGLGYVDRMDTTKWTREKRVRFDFNVLFNRDGTWEQYNAGEWIELPVTGSSYPYYNFYCLLANSEVKAASVQYDVEAINCAPSPGGDSNPYLRDTNLDNDNTLQDNKTRTRKFTSKHGAFKDSVIDVVGRIGNLIVSDTGDYRFSNLFKVPVSSEEWIVDGIVKKVIVGAQNKYMAWGNNNGSYGQDLRGKTVAAGTHWYDVYGYQNWLDTAPVLLPLSPDRNNIAILKNEPMRPGYDVFFEISTLGNYNRQLQITPYFYALNLKSNEVTPVDVYIYTNGDYEPINLYDVVGSADWGTTKNEIYPYTMNLDWVDEASRRNYSMDEKRITDALAQLYKEVVRTPNDEGGWDATAEKEMNRPLGKYYQLGNAQLLTPGTKARTFIGNSQTNTETFNGSHDTNFGNKLQEYQYWEKAQRWHLKMGIPSSSVFVGYKNNNRIEPTDTVTNVDGKEVKAYEEYQNDNYAILMTMDIKAVGDTFVLQYDQGNNNGSVKIGEKTYTFGNAIPSVLAVYSANKSSINDVDILKTH